MQQGPLGDAAAWAAHGFVGEPADLVAAGTLTRAWAARWAAAPDAPVLRDGTAWITAAELAERTARVAGRLAGAGVAPGDRVVVSAAPGVDLVVAHVALLRLGAVVVPVNTALSRDELARVATESRPALAVLDDIGRIDPGLGVAVTGPDVALADGAPPPLDATAPDDPALLVFTSGTTGRPKGAVLSQANALASAAAVVRAWGWSPSDRLVLALPLFHVHGLGVGVHGTLLAGASAVVLGRFDAGAVLDAAAAERATMFFGVPTMYVKLAESPRAGELGRLRLCVSGSAPMAPDLWDAIHARGGQRVVERYGMTETLMLVSNPLVGDRRPGSVGLALPGVRVRLAGPTGDAAGAGGSEPGEILVQGPNVMAGYWERPEATVEAFDDAGWFRTGDLGRFDADGYLRIVGRSKDVIITGGYNVYPRDVEELLREHPAVADVAVVGRPDPTWGETVVACVVRRDGVGADALAALCAERLAPHQRPREFRFVEDLPRNALGKVVKAQLLG